MTMGGAAEVLSSARSNDRDESESRSILPSCEFFEVEASGPERAFRASERVLSVRR